MRAAVNGWDSIESFRSLLSTFSFYKFLVNLGGQEGIKKGVCAFWWMTHG